MNEDMHTCLARCVWCIYLCAEGHVISRTRKGKNASSLSHHSKTMGSITQAIQMVLDVNTNVIIDIFHKHKWIKQEKWKRLSQYIMHLTLDTQITPVIALLYIWQLAPFLYLNTENKIKTLKNIKIKNLSKKILCIKGDTKHLSNIFTSTIRSLLCSTKEQKQTWLASYPCLPKHRWVTKFNQPI